MFVFVGGSYGGRMGRREVEGEASRLRAARRESQLSLTDFASKVGYSRSYLSAVELGHLPETEPVVLAYETVLGLEPGTLQDGKQSVARVLRQASQLEAATATAATVSDGFRLPEGQLVILPRADVLRSIASLTAEALVADIRPGQVHLTSFSGDEDWRQLDAPNGPWISVQQDLERAGWAINHLIRLNDDVSRSLLLMGAMLGLLADPGEYRALFAPIGAAMPPTVDYFVIEGCCALIRFDIEDPLQQAVMLIRDRAGVAAVAQQCELLRAMMRPMIEAITRDDPAAFEGHRVRIGSEPGDSVMVRGTLSVGAVDVVEDELAWLPSTHLESEASRRAEVQSRLLLATLKRNRVRHIYIKSQIEESVQMALRVGSGLILSEADDRFLPRLVRHRLDQLIALLREQRNFEMALLDDDEVALIQAPGSDSVFYWLVQGGELLLESWPRGGSGVANHLHIAVHESSIAAAFMEHFKNVWQRVKPVNRDKEYVTWWLEQQAALLG